MVLSAAAEPATLPPGSPLVFVSDTAVDIRTVRPGAIIRAHLLGDLTLGGAVLAAAGTTADLLIVDAIRGSAPAQLRIALEHFAIKSAAADLPVVPVDPLVEVLPVGTVVPARTVGSVVHDGDRTIVRAPLPFSLSTDAPNAAYTPLSYRTTAPVVPPRRSTPSPPASPSTGASPPPTAGP